MPFSYRLLKDKKALIYYKGKEVSTAGEND
jgi:hypothetical protein